jgi:hypothetical protein
MVDDLKAWLNAPLIDESYVPIDLKINDQFKILLDKG